MTTDLAVRPRYADVRVGQRLPDVEHAVRRVDLIRYAGASGDFNVIHWNERFAVSVGLPGIIAHGMLTLAVAMRAVTDWSGDASAVLECGGRFAKPVVVPDDADGALLIVSGVVAELLPDNKVRIDVSVRRGADKVLARSRAVVRLD